MKTPGIATATFFEDTAPIGSLCAIGCDELTFRLVKLNWGAEEDYERSREGEVEMTWSVSGEALARLKKSAIMPRLPMMSSDICMSVLLH